MEEKKRIPIKEGLWVVNKKDNSPHLIGSRCNRCGEIFFPKKELNICSYCQSMDLEEIHLSSKGKVFSYTVVMQRPPEYYKGEIPYAIGFVELPEGVRIESLFTGCNFDEIRIGMEVEMVIEKLYEDEMGNEVLTYKFRPFK